MLQFGSYLRTMKLSYLLLILLLIAFLPIFLGFLIKEIPEYAQPVSQSTMKVYGEIKAIQSFEASKNNLSVIGVSFKNPNLINTKNMIMEIDSEGEQRRAEVNGRIIGDGQFIKFKFDPIKNTEGKIVSFSLSSTESTYNDSLEVYLTDQPDLSYKGLALSGKVEKGQIAFVPYYSTSNGLETSINIMRIFLTKFVKDSVFFVIYLLLFGGLLGYLIYLKSKETN